MDISFSEQDLQFQEEIRSALENDYPSHVREKQEQGMVLSKQDMIDFINFCMKKTGQGITGLLNLVELAGLQCRYISF